MRRLVPSLLLAACLAGCGKDNPVKPDNKPLAYPILSSPQNVLTALAESYSRRDSVETKIIYDSTYVGTSVDLTEPPQSQFLTFHYFDEIEHVAALARSTTITSVVLDFGGPLIRLPSDDSVHPEWAVIQIPGSNMQLVIYDTPNPSSLDATGEFMKFKFRPSAPEFSSPTDTLWRIVRWEEVHQ
jgi:hypothetical protein